jgi:hypothetical protein
MTAQISSSVRYLFVSTVATALIFAGLEAAAAKYERMGINSCGWEGNPCELAPLVVKAPAVVGPLARS